MVCPFTAPAPTDIFIYSSNAIANILSLTFNKLNLMQLLHSCLPQCLLFLKFLGELLSRWSFMVSQDLFLVRFSATTLISPKKSGSFSPLITLRGFVCPLMCKRRFCIFNTLQDIFPFFYFSSFIIVGVHFYGQISKLFIWLGDTALRSYFLWLFLWTVVLFDYPLASAFSFFFFCYSVV